MNSLIAWFAKNPVAANLLMVVILAAGVAAAFKLPLEDFPEFPPDALSISMTYRGATPAEVEESVIVRIEEAIADLPGIKQIISEAREGTGVVTVQVEKGHNVREMMDDVKIRVDSISTFPEETERPIISTDSMRGRVVSVLVTGDLDERELRRMGEQVRDDLQRLEGVTSVELRGVRTPEISIEVSESDLRRYNLTLDDVAEAIRRSSLDLPAGGIKTAAGEVMIRTKGQAYLREEFETLVLRTSPEGARLLVRDVATVQDGFGDNPLYCRVDGRPAVLVQVYRTGSQNILEIAKEVNRYLESAPARLPPGVELSLWRDNSLNVRIRLSMLIQDAVIGAILVVLLLGLMLRPSLAGWVSLGIPVGFAGGLLVMYLAGVTLNRLTVFGFIVVVGIVVDDAIVCGENIYAHLMRGKKPLEAAIDGAREVGVPVVFGVLANVAAFTPILFLPGRMGQVYMQIPAVVIPVFLFSLLECTLILPARLRLMNMRRDHALAAGARPVWHERGRAAISDGLQWVITRVYQPVLGWSLDHKAWVYSVFAASLIVAAGYVGGGHIIYTQMPPVYNETVTASLEMPSGTPADLTETEVRRINTAALELQAELAREHPGVPPIKKVMMMMGGRGGGSGGGGGGGGRGGGSGFGGLASGGATHLGEVTIELTAAEGRDLDAGVITERWRNKVGEIIGVKELNFFNRYGRWGSDIDIQISGTDLAEMDTVSEEVQEHLKTYQGVFDVHGSVEDGKSEIQLKVKPAALTLGLSEAELGRQVREAFYGAEAQRIQRGRDDLRIMVRYPRSERESLHNLETMKIRTRDGHEVPFATVAELRFGKSFSTILREDRRRVMSVRAAADTIGVDMQRLQDQVEVFLNGLRQQHPGIDFSFEGAARDQRESWAGLWWGVAMALFALYGLMAMPFRSYFQPLVVMSVIPFCVLGAVGGHLVRGLNLSFFSILGMLAVAGVAVNNGIILVDFINQRREQGLPLRAAVLEAGRARFRAVFLTSATTFVGLLPLMFAQSTQAQFLTPMAVSMGFGVIVSTLVTLLLVPLNYSVLENSREALRRWFGERPAPVAQSAS